MKKVRYGMFETNSSMTHVLTLCTPDEWEKFKDGELLWDRYREKLVEHIPWDGDEGDYCDYDQWRNDDWFETFKEEHELTNGQKVVAFGYYGHD